MSFLVFAIILLRKRKLVALLHCFLVLVWLSEFCVFSWQYRGLVYCLWLWHFLAILTCSEFTNSVFAFLDENEVSLYFQIWGFLNLWTSCSSTLGFLIPYVNSKRAPECAKIATTLTETGLKRINYMYMLFDRKKRNIHILRFASGLGM